MAEMAEAGFWERVSLTTRWGAYVSAVEKRAILRGHASAQPTGLALEIGCESGRWSQLLSALGWRMTCIDIDPRALDLCQRRLPHATCLLARCSDSSIPCQAKSQNLAVCIEVAPVIHSPWFLPEAQRVLAQHGVLVGINWNRTSWRGCVDRVRRQSGGGSREDYYRRAYRTYRAELAGAGFEVLHEEGYCWSPFPRTSNSRLISVFVRAERMLGLHRWIALSPWIAFVARKR